MRLSRSKRRTRELASTPSDDDGFQTGFEEALTTTGDGKTREVGCGGGGVPGESRPKSNRFLDECGEREAAKPTYLCRAAEAFLDGDDRDAVARLVDTLNGGLVAGASEDACSQL